ncbi:hypothetical protein CON36_34885 [Bacillus cereus]|uniref:Uncharacterized protein n=2 Tax=Bacillus cereus group TaxID=86661 RepID=A0A9X6SSA5_BACCE|nr:MULTISPECIES: hypothetical protein [Bacillus cereus group]PDZ94229.1 hypothetical protein CON36_34885 [Bacillus cereus]PFJ24681.1 hypothetical protein COJ15_36355 [Bacillus thuringiensis]PGP11999.1 hypothetical protein COA01_34840 [Bacillus cereus]
MFIGQKVKVENSPWTDANGETGEIKSIIPTSNEGNIALVKFDNEEINRTSRDIGGFTFKNKELKAV